ncbi:MAG: transposase [Marinilabiliaceae bacterium]|nr:transposase [Marinilabiliaceae bacterium]
MNNHKNLEPGRFYHIYNKARNEADLFRESTNYDYFLKLYDRYLFNHFETFAWVLMPNHFHFLIRTSPRLPDKPFHQYLSNLFNAYTKAFNKKYNRVGPLFKSPFERKEVTDSNQFRNLVHYIHNNPVHHGFSESMIEYRWSSYQTIVSLRPTKLNREVITGWFNGKDEFVKYHQGEYDYTNIKDLMID